MGCGGEAAVDDARNVRLGGVTLPVKMSFVNRARELGTDEGRAIWIVYFT